MSLQQTQSLLVDGCALINLYATGRIAQICNVLPPALLISDYDREHTWGSLLSIVRSVDSEQSTREPVDLNTLIGSGLLNEVCLNTDDEAETYLRLAMQQELGDGEARILALAIHRGTAVLTDDKSARRFIRGQRTIIPTFTSGEIIRESLALIGSPKDEITEVLHRVEMGVRFRPSRDDPAFTWWNEHLPSTP